MPNGMPPWKWTETQEFASYCYAILPEEDVSDVDQLRMVIHDTVLFNPLEAPHVFQPNDPKFNPAIRWFTVLDAKRWAFPPSVVVFRVDSEPQEDGTPGEVTGLAAWTWETVRNASQ